MEILRSIMNDMCDKYLSIMINGIFGSRKSLDQIRPCISDDYSYHGSRKVSVQMPFGTHQEIKSHWLKKKPSTGRRKRGPKTKDSKRKGSHIFLDLLGFEGLVSQPLYSKALKMSALCPSSEIASEILKDYNITFSQNKMRRHISNFVDLSDDERANLSCIPQESLSGKKVLLCVDGGRIRSRVNKSGRIAEGNQRHGFHTDWKEPKMFTIYTLKENGEIDEHFPAQIDGVVGNEKQFQGLLEAYLKKLKISECKSVTFVGDGAKWQWLKIPALLKKLKVKKSQVVEVIDYMHAKQNLHGILENCSKGLLNAHWSDLQVEAEDLLYSGKVEELGALIKNHSNKGFKRENQQKWQSYFLGNAKRMKYQQFKENGHPIGSGSVESAIRRVINLRIKSPAIFWKVENAEAMIFIRSKVLYGRWDTVMSNIREKKRKTLLKNEL